MWVAGSPGGPSPSWPVLSLLRWDAARWWYNAQLRGRGQVEEAEKRERASVRENVKSLRAARDAGGFLTIGRGGATLYSGAHSRTSGLHPANELAAKKLLPWCDTTTVPEENLGAIVRLPMPLPGLVERVPCPTIPDWMLGPGGLEGGFLAMAEEQGRSPGMLDEVPFAEYARAAEALGATVGGLSL